MEPDRRPVEVDIRLRLRFRSSYHFRASGATSGDLDAHLLRRDGQEPLLLVPGSTLKGRLRDHAARIWNARPGGEPCVGGDGCPVCLVFGAAGAEPGRLRFLDALQPIASAALGIRTHVGLDPATRTAAAHRLYAEEVSPPGLVFEARAVGYLPAPRARAGLGLLAGAAALLRTMGGGKSRGLGWVEARPLQARCGPDLLEPVDLRAAFEQEVLGR